jgi:hypothetical protein
MVAHAMFDKGMEFIVASIFLDQNSRGQNGTVVLHLLAQGLEVIQKALLLARDYNTYQPQLRKPLGHDLLKGAEALRAAYNLRPMKRELDLELRALNWHYRNHLLRYGGIHDILGATSRQLKCQLIFKRVSVLARLGKKHFK